MKFSYTYFFYPLIFSFILILNNSCASHVIQLKEPIEVDQNFTALSDAIVERDVDLLWYLKENSNRKISDAAWRGLAIAKINDLRELIDYAMDTDHPNAWYVLRFQSLSKEEIEEISVHFFTSDVQLGPICSLFFSQSDRWTLDMMLNHSEMIRENEVCAMAIGGMLTRIEAGDKNVKRVTKLVNEIDDEIIQSNLLYGFWRSPINRPAPESAAFENLFHNLENRVNSTPALVDEYLVRLTGARGLQFVMSNRSDSDLFENVQLSVELARSVRNLKVEELNKEFVYRLLNHPNPHVAVMVLESLLAMDNLVPTWIEGLFDQSIHIPENGEVHITYLELLQKNGISIDDMGTTLENIDIHHPYLKNRILGLYREQLVPDDYLEKILTYLETEGFEAMHAAMAFAEYAGRHSQPVEIRDIVRETLSAAIVNQNRSVITVSGQLLINRSFFDKYDKNLFLTGYNRAIENENHEIAQLLFDVMLELGLIEDGFNHEIRSDEFLLPDWARILELGDDPLWVLETNRGKIVIRLDPITAPFTIYSIDSLTTAGMYDGVNFHRVVRNFVIQGGDFDRRDGLGGPGYRVPTEPAFYTFERGKVGMASSGQDTEGSQFFITHTWTPHLDGLYTIFGEVVEGMDVVDLIQIGDVVISAEIVKSEK